LQHFYSMNSTSNQNRDLASPLRLMEPDLAAWAEKITIDATKDRRGLWYGAALFWIVVVCLVAARIVFLDPHRIQPSSASSTQSTVAGAPSAAHATKL
jgi:hypothetical protein